MKAYNLDRKDSKWPHRSMLITLLVKQLEGKMKDIRCAPPREMLKNFGGGLTISEFRENNFAVEYDNNCKVVYSKTKFSSRKKI